MMRCSRFLYSLLLLAWLAACTAPGSVRDSGPAHVPQVVYTQPEPQPRDEPLSASGNQVEYEVFGRRYVRMASALDYEAEGVASWYGRKFHGRATASGDIYDMYALSAAHRTLPLPTYVRVTRLDTDRSVIVKVNDRGPFVGDRLIDLSFAAAARLDMLHLGTARVKVQALSVEAGTRPAVTRPVTPQPVISAAPGGVDPDRPFLQVGAFGTFAAADRLTATLEAALASQVFIVRFPADALYRVRLGPFTSAVNQAQVAEELRRRWQLEPMVVD